MATVSTMILRSMRMNGEKVRGATLTSDEAVECLAELNTMMEAWSIEGLMCPSLVQDSKALTSSVGSYTIGSGGAFNTTRPTKIVDPCFIRDSGGSDYPLRLIDAHTYGLLIDKDIDGTYPEYLYYDGAFVAGLGTIYLYPEPLSGLTLYINSWKQMPSFANVSTEALLPPGYQLAIESNFAIHQAAGLRQVAAEVVKIAKDSKAAIKSLNSPIEVLRLDAGVVGARGGNILTGP